MERIDWMQCYSNQSITANEWLQWALKHQQRLWGKGQDIASLSWWKGAMGTDKVQCSTCQVGAWVQWEGGWLCQPISHLTSYMFWHIVNNQFFFIMCPVLICLQMGVKYKSSYILMPDDFLWLKCISCAYKDSLSKSGLFIKSFCSCVSLHSPLDDNYLKNEMPASNLSGARNSFSLALFW